MSVLDRALLQSSPLADLHAIASELSIDGYRRLRREQLIDAILARQGAAEGPQPPTERAEEPPERAEEPPERPQPPTERAEEPAEWPQEPAERAEEPAEWPQEPAERAEEPAEWPQQPAERAQPPARRQEPIVEGEVEILPDGSGLLHPDPPAQDVLIAAAQVRRCELVSGDRISGPRRPPRRSERLAALQRVDTINGRPAQELADRPRFEELPAAFPDQPLRLGADDPTLEAIERLTPIGRGSRVTLVGGARAGKSETLRRLASALAGRGEVRVLLVLAGVRPEEIPDWPLKPLRAVSFAAAIEDQEQAVASVVDQGRRLAARGEDAVVVLDTLDGLGPHARRRALAAARNLREGGSLTVIATSSEPVGGETTVIALDPALTAAGRFPALDLAASGTIRPELLVGEAGAAAIRAARAAQ